MKHKTSEKTEDCIMGIGIVRNLDTLGRVVLPKEYRVQLDIGNGDPVEILRVEEGILVRKHISNIALEYQLAVIENSLHVNNLSKEETEAAIVSVERIAEMLNKRRSKQEVRDGR